jgi:trehalose 6-phosphate phosphatase
MYASSAVGPEALHPTIPPSDRTALLLDVDGTLLDIASAPDRVMVPPDLILSLRALRERLGGAIAVISGRPVEQVEALLPDTVTAIAGEHGGAIRFAPDEKLERPALPKPPEAWFAAGERLAATHPGTLFERKPNGFVLHYRSAPAAGPALRDALIALANGSERFTVLPALMAWELHPRGADKGRAVTALMRRPPFAGRLPVFIGDDVTDEYAIEAAERMGGIGLRVMEAFGTPDDVRAWLREAARGEAW